MLSQTDGFVGKTTKKYYAEGSALKTKTNKNKTKKNSPLI